MKARDSREPNTVNTKRKSQQAAWIYFPLPLRVQRPLDLHGPGSVSHKQQRQAPAGKDKARGAPALIRVG